MASTVRSPTKANFPVSPEFSRRGLSRSENATTPTTPPARFISSNFSTPGSTYGREEDAVILELSPRYIKAGIEGESHAQCRYDFAPGDTYRVGDYRQHLPGYIKSAESLSWSSWGSQYELWKNDVKDLDLGLVGDKLERAVREIYNKHLLVDAGTARLILVVPNLVSHPVLDTILTTLFERWTFPSITLLPNTAAALVSAGLRSGLIVDIGWEETVVTVVYEYREIRSCRSMRGTKMLSYNFAEYLKTKLPGQCRIDLETVETFWRRIAPHMNHAAAMPQSEEQETKGEQSDLEYDWPTTTFTEHVKLSKAPILQSWIKTLFGGPEDKIPDDEELPLHDLLWSTLNNLPYEIRGICQSRIVFIGDGSRDTPFPEMIVSALAQREATNKSPDAKHSDVVFSEKEIAEERYLREKHKSRPPVQSGIRRVDTLGSWTGATLLSTLKVKSFVEVQRDRFLSHGVAGASRDYDQSMSFQARTTALGMRPKGERTSWTMAGFG